MIPMTYVPPGWQWDKRDFLTEGGDGEWLFRELRPNDVDQNYLDDNHIFGVVGETEARMYAHGADAARIIDALAPPGQSLN